MIKIILLIIGVLLIIIFFADKIIKNLFERNLFRYLSYTIILILLLAAVLFTRFESESSKGTYSPPYYDGTKIKPGKVEHE